MKFSWLPICNADNIVGNIMSGSSRKKLFLIHFNDVYQVESRKEEPVGGAARFVTALNSFKQLNPMVLFSGDIFSPSLLSTFARGDHMIPVLNRCEVHVAVFGNHDFDFGLDSCMALTAETSFPWLLSNVKDLETNRPLAEGRITYITRWNGFKVGFMGLVEREWLDTLSTINPDEVQFIDYLEMGNRLAVKLRDEGCDLVIALTHMRLANDSRLLAEAVGIDLILGGHDHDYEVHRNEKCLLVKSGTDFREFSLLELTRQKSGWVKDVKRIEVTSRFEEDDQLKAQLQQFIDMTESHLNDIIACFEVDLEGRFSKSRTEETNLGNFCGDVILATMNADCVMYNSGTLRSDQIHRAGDFTMRDLVTISPFLDGLVLLEVSGTLLHEALENAVCMYPRLEGRFAQVSGLSFVFDPTKEPGQRVDPRYIKVADKFMKPEQLYRLAVKEYMFSGKDGYTCLVNCHVLQDVEESPMLRTAIANHFDSIYRLKGYCGPQAAMTSHRQSIVALSRRDSRLKDTLEQAGLHRPESTLLRRNSYHHPNMPPETAAQRRTSVQAASVLNFHAHIDPLYDKSAADGHSKVDRHANAPHTKPLTNQRLQLDVEQIEMQAARLAPKVEGRIRISTPKLVSALEAARKLEDLVENNKK